MPFGRVAPPGLELRLHQRDDVGAVGDAAAASGGRMWRERDERHVDGDDAGRALERGDVGGGQVPRVDALDHDDARIAAQPPVQLAVADVERDDARAPRCSSTSVKPPVDAPMSSASRPVTSMPKASSACASLTPPRLTYG